MSSVLDEMYNEGREEGRKEGREEVREEARKEGREEGREEARAETLFRLMQYNSWTLDQAMNMMGYPLEKKARYEQLLAALPVQ